jgi:hypothetical protein
VKVSTWVRSVPSSQASALLNEVRARIEAALAEEGARDEATVYQVLDRLGPPVGFVERLALTPRSPAQQVIDTVLAPVTRARAVLASRCWGFAEIGALLLLVVGPFVLWWLGPLFGIALVRVAADRWSAAVTKRATVFVAVMLAVQFVIAVALFAFVLPNRMELLFQPLWVRVGPFDDWLTPGGAGSLSLIELLIISPAFIAGIGSAIYLARGRRYRPPASGSVAVEPN